MEGRGEVGPPSMSSHGRTVRPRSRQRSCHSEDRCSTVLGASGCRSSHLLPSADILHCLVRSGSCSAIVIMATQCRVFVIAASHATPRSSVMLPPTGCRLATSCLGLTSSDRLIKEITMSIGQELSSIDFQSMIGGPLNAVIKAQAQSAQTSVDFIKSVQIQMRRMQRPIRANPRWSASRMTNSLKRKIL